MPIAETGHEGNNVSSVVRLKPIPRAIECVVLLPATRKEVSAGREQLPLIHAKNRLWDFLASADFTEFE